MIHFIVENLSTILIAVLLFAAVAGIIRKMRNDKKSGKSSCGCGCGGCASSAICHPEKHKK